MSEIPLVLTPLKENQVRTIITSNAYGTVYLLETYEGDTDSNFNYNLDDGKAVKRLEALDEFAFTGSMNWIANNRQLVMYNSPEDESKDITWKVYNFEKNRLTEHRVMGKYPNQFGMTQIFNTDQRLY